MADISVKRAHGKDLASAREMTQKVVKEVQVAFPKLVNSIEWNGDNSKAKVKGKGFTGEFEVDATNISIEISLSMLTRPFKGRVEQKVGEWMEKFTG